MKEYNFRKIEKKWQKLWENEKYGIADDFSEKPKFYSLIEFPYPSGEGLHVGHCMMYAATDAHARMKRMQGFNVMFPMGWDAFGLPTENYAIKNKINPKDATRKNISNFKRQQKEFGCSFDYSREINTTDPKYYKWTQWIFLQFYKHAVIDNKLIEVADDDTTTPRLAFQAEMPVNWCPSCKINLANEEVIGGKCERCGEETEKKMQKQWMLRITAYADRLIKDLDTVDYEERIKTQQINWIGRSKGASLKFKVKSLKLKDKDINIEVFTTRADTLFGATFMAITPEHDIVSNLKSQISNFEEVKEYIKQAKKKSDLERTDLEKDKTGVELQGIKAINPINNEEIPIFVADYVLSGYGTGAVMCVPAHDERDFEFAKKYNLPIRYVIEPKFVGASGDGAVKPGLKFVRRNAICAIVRNPKNNKYLCISWKGILMHGLVTGGIDENEDLVDTARRELKEETGYKNLKFIKVAPLAINTYFYHRVKKENRWAHFQYVFFDLENEDRDEIDQHEAALHEVLWKSKDELKEFFNVFEGEYLIELIENDDKSYVGEGLLANSVDFNGLDSDEAGKKITNKLKEMGVGDFAVNYKLRDWIFSRQHYWGEPIPIVHCKKCGMIPLKDDQLPLELPEVENYEPTNTGESPLAKIDHWVNTTCPKCGGTAKRETDTMPNWAGSSWYFLRYCDSNNDKEFASMEKLKQWMPVDLYNGGMEHTTLHLLYSRFWHKFLYDLGKVPTLEPYQKRIAHGIILGTDGRKMSKSFGNTINPDDMIEKFGADTLRAYIMFIGPYDQESAWNMNGIQGVYRFVKKVWDNFNKVSDSEIPKNINLELNKIIKYATRDIEKFSFNTYIAKLMEFNNILSKEKNISKEVLKKFIMIFSPAMPYLAEELWQVLGEDKSIFKNEWPAFNQNIIQSEDIEIPIQVNGKVRDRLHVSFDVADDELKKLALESEKIIELLGGKEPTKVIVVPKRLVSIVI